MSSSLPSSSSSSLQLQNEVTSLEEGNIDDIISCLCNSIEKHDNSFNIIIIIRKLRELLCPHSIHLSNARIWDYNYYYILKTCILPSYPRISWYRLCKKIMILDLNHTTPYDGTNGFVKTLMNTCLELIDNIYNNNIRKSLQLIRCESYEQRNIATDNTSTIEIPNLLHITSSYPTAWSLLHHAASLIIPSNEIITMLVNEGLSLGVKDSNGCTPLHIAAKVINLSTVIHLTNYGASIKDIDNDGKTPLLTLLLAIAKRTYSNNRLINSELLYKCITVLTGDPSLLWNDNGQYEHALVLAIAYTDEFVAENVIRIASGCPSRWNRDVLHRVLFFTAKNKRIKAVESIFEQFGDFVFKDFDVRRCLNQGSEPTETISHQHFTEFSEYNLMQTLYKEAIISQSRHLLKTLIGDYKQSPCNLLHLIYMCICLKNMTSLNILTEYADITPFILTAASDVSRLHLFNLSPLSLAVYSGDLYVTKVLVSCLRYRLKSRDIQSVAINPVICCVLTNNYDCLAYLAAHMGRKQFSMVCWQKDSFGYLPIQVLLQAATTSHDDKKTEISQAARRRYSDTRSLENVKTLKILNLICDSDVTKQVNMSSMYKISIDNVWLQRISNLQNILKQTNDKINDLEGKMTTSRKEYMLYGKEIQWLRYQRWKEVLLLINSRDFVSKMRILIRSTAFDQNWDMLAQCILLALGESGDAGDSLKRKQCLWWVKFVKFLGGYSKQSSDRMTSFINQMKEFAYPFVDENKSRVVDKSIWSEISRIHASHAISKKNYFSDLKSKALRKGKHIGTHVEYGLQVLNMWVDVIILDCKLMHGTDFDISLNENIVSAHDALALSELQHCKTHTENIISHVQSLVKCVDKRKPTVSEESPSYLSMIDMMIRPERNSCSTVFQEMYSTFNVHGYISSIVPPSNELDLSKDDSTSCIGIHELSNKLKEDLIISLIEKRESFSKHAGGGVQTECPLLSLCVKGMWKAANSLLSAWIKDGYDISRSMYVFNDEIRLGNILESCKRNLFNTDSSTDTWSSVDIHKVKVITPLSLAVYSRQTNFVSTFLSSYPHYKVSTELMQFCLKEGYSEMILILATRINSFRASSFLITSANIDERPSDYRVYTKHNIYYMTKAPISLAKQMNTIMTRAINKALEAVETASHNDMKINTSGSLSGLCTISRSSTGLVDVLLMDGTAVPLDVFCKDVSYLRRALPIPLCGIGINSSGITVLHESKEYGNVDDSENICQFLLDKGSWRTLTVDRHGRYPVYNILCSGNIKLVIQMLSRAISLQGSPMHIEDYHILHTVVPVSIDAERLLRLPAINEVERLRLQKQQYLLNEEHYPLHYPTKSGLIHASLKKTSVWDELLQCDFSAFTQISLSQSGCTIDSIIRARRILTLLGIPYTNANTRFSDTAFDDRADRNKLVKLLDNADLYIDKDINWNVYLQLKELLFGWLRNRNPKQNYSSKPNSVEESMFLFHNFACSLHDIGTKGHSKSFKSKGSNGHHSHYSDEKENNISLHDRLVYETKIQYKGMGSILSSNPNVEYSTPMINSLNLSLAIIESWNRNELQGLEQALDLSYSILDLARWIVIEKTLQSLKVDAIDSDDTKQATEYCHQWTQAKSTLEAFRSKFVDEKMNTSMLFASGLSSKIMICEDVVSDDLMTVLYTSSSTKDANNDDKLNEIRDLVTDGLLSVMKVKGDTRIIDMITTRIKSMENGPIDLEPVLTSLNETRISDILVMRNADAFEIDVLIALFKRIETVTSRLEVILGTSHHNDDDHHHKVLSKSTRVLYETATKIKNFFRAVSYLHKNGDSIYEQDVNNWIKKAAQWNPLVPLVLPPSLIKYKEKTLGLMDSVSVCPFQGNLWDTLTAEEEEDRRSCCELLLSIGVTPNTSHSSNAIAIAAIFGYDSILSTMLESSESDHSMNKYLIWNILYGIAIDSPDERRRQNKLHKAHCNCLKMLVDNDFPIMLPPNAKASCSDLAILKKIDSSLVNIIILKEQLSYMNLVDSDDDDDDDDGGGGGGGGGDRVSSANKIIEKKLFYCLSPHAPADILETVPANFTTDQVDLGTVAKTLDSIVQDRDVYCTYVLLQLSHLEFQQRNVEKWWEASKQAVQTSVKSRVTVILEETFGNFFAFSKFTKYCPLRSIFSHALKPKKASVDTDIEWYPVYSVLSNGNLDLFRNIVQPYFEDVCNNKEKLALIIMYSVFYDQKEALDLMLARLNLFNLRIWDEEYRFAPFGKITTATSIAMMFSPSCLQCLMTYGASVSWEQFVYGVQSGFVNDTMGVHILRHISQQDTERQHLFSEPLEDGDTLLHLACRRGHVALVRYLLSIKTKIYIDSNGYLPIHYSISCGHGQVTKLLIVSSFFLRRALKILFHYSRSFLVSRKRRQYSSLAKNLESIQ